jgi:hypothetical protein
VVVASNGGHSQHPAWWLNLQKTPLACALVQGRRAPVVAHELTGEERSPLWTSFVDMYPGLVDSTSATRSVCFQWCACVAFERARYEPRPHGVVRHLEMSGDKVI